MRRSSVLVGWIAMAGLAASCTGEFTTPPPPDFGGGVLPRCGEVGEPLSIPSGGATVGAGQLHVLIGLGGTNAHRWSFVENASGGSIDERNGVYVAGSPDPDLATTVDVVQLEDANCRSEAPPRVSITVIDAPSILPRTITVERGESVDFQGDGGSGTFTFAIAANVSGGSITPAGRYTAGATLGRDVVRLTDTILGSTADATVQVVADASLRIDAGEWAIPVGSTATLPITGGSGVFETSIMGAGVEIVSGSTVLATAEGTAMLTFRDTFTGRTLTTTVRAIAPHQAERRHASDRSENHNFGGTRDGFVVVGMPDATGDWYDAGLVVIYKGSDGALDPTPARILSGGSRDEEFGMSVTLGDLDADGEDDLIVGARRADPTRTDVGAVYVYSGLGGGDFAEEPTRRFFGQNSFDLFGDSVAVCDFNGDGLLDLAVGAPFGQDPDGANDQGVVSVFLAYPGGRFISAPDVSIYGLVPDGSGGWAPLQNQRLGESIAAGDIDGDGICDLAAYTIAPGADSIDTGAVAVYRGRPVDGPDRGGPETIPALFWARSDGTDDNARFGQGLAVGDLNGDGRADILAPRNLHDGAAGTDTGALYVRFGSADLLSSPATGITDISTADWSIEGESADRMGHSVVVYDVNGDGTDDIVSGDSRAQVMDSMISRPGLVRVYFGGGSLPTTASRTYEGPQANERFGLGVGVVARPGAEAGILAFAPYHDTVEGENDDRGAIYFAPASGAPTELTRTPPASGQKVGESVAWIGDLNGDGFPELAVGSSQTDVTGVGVNLGAVRIYAGTASGASAAPSQVLSGFASHGESDEVGWAVAPAGDFDGDGNPDLLVLARSEDLPSTLDTAVYEPGPGCDSSRNNSGAVLVFGGRGDGSVTAEPIFAFYGPETDQRFENVLGGFDANGDGVADLAIGGREWDGGGSNAGGVEIVFGRARPTDGRIGAICTADRHVDGAVAGDRLGSSLAALGDLDADGCDEIAAGAPEADPGGTRNAGEVYVYWGYGATCTATSARTTRLFGNDQDSQGGLALSGGLDLTGDGSPDLLIGAPRFRDGRGEVGRVVLVNGAYIAARADGQGSFVNAGAGGTLAVDGTSPGERLGSALAMALLPGGGRVAVLGGPLGGASGIVDTGGVAIYDVGAMGFGVTPRLRVTGESVGRGELGSSVSALRSMGRTFVAVGAPWSSSPALGGAVDDGASYAFTMN